MNILSIGNSFSQDAQRYLHRIAKSAGYELNSYNLYVGGCPLSRHHEIMITGEKAYELEINGETTGEFVSLDDVITKLEWDIITVQQVSQESPDFSTYEPYLTELVDYVRKCVPKAKIAVHQTWAYEDGSERLTKELSYKKHEDMFKDIEVAYKKAYDLIDADFLIPSGKLFEGMLASGIEKIHRDTFHARLGLGRYALSLLWYAVLIGGDIENITFNDFDEPITDKEMEIAKACVKRIISE